MRPEACFGSGSLPTYLLFPRSLILAVPPPRTSPFSFSTNRALFTERFNKGKGTEKPGCLFGVCPTV